MFYFVEYKRVKGNLPVVLPLKSGKIWYYEAMEKFLANGRHASGLPIQSQAVETDDVPVECPICGRIVNAEMVYTPWLTDRTLEVFLRCPNPNCLRTYIAQFVPDKSRVPRAQTLIFKFVRFSPVEPKVLQTPDDVKRLSPDFERIYAQAQAAEDHGLEDIAGPGYRKALEFLIKDFAISLVSDEEQKAEIRRILLQAVIRKFLPGDKLPIVSSRAAWLGNDETHYERRWVGKDLSDLKKLIRAVEHFISMQTLVDSLQLDMPDPSTKSKSTV